MTVALCSAQFGAGGQSFGTGRDGGREWTYRGSLPMPQLPIFDIDADHWVGGDWSGYSVVQAKHKERLAGGAEDTDWLLTTIQKEVNAWTREKRPRRPKPNNFLVITNVRLSAVQDVGGIDRVAEAMAKHAVTMNLSGWAIWHSAHISRLLDNHVGIRQTYLGLVTTGDILEALLRDINVPNPDAVTTLTGFVAKELAANSSVRLTRAGNGPDYERLADIGIDLPAQDRKKPSNDDGTPVHHFIARDIIEHGDHAKRISDGDFSTVLIGGPGQGKSTIGQLICQSYRAAILKDRARELTPEVRGILSDTLVHLAEINVPLPRMLRWPVFVRLTEYSEKILGAEDYSLLRFITDQVNARGGPHTVQRSHVYSWQREWPWLIVLDGLDEVPDVGTRTILLQKISEFVTDAAQQKADMTILATTRRQGYEDDLSSLEPREFELVELSTKQALHYGRQLVNSRHPADLPFAGVIHQRLVEAAKETMTAKLMGTPLQVSIMASLLEDRTRLPRTRHALFSEFYETVFKREANKLGTVGHNVTRHKANIDAVHNSAGALLHVESEKAGQADVHLSRGDLCTLAQKHLEEVQTYDPSDAERTAGELISLATDRFILLVETSTDHWGFEVRSFQEFMASRYIASGPDDEVISHLQTLALSSHWRNTWLFAAAQIFESRQHLRERILDVVLEIDSQSVAHYVAKPGAVLCGDLLMDNFAADTPGLQRRLLLHAVELLDSPLLRRGLIPVLHAAAERDAVVRMKIQDLFRAAMSAGGWKKAVVTSAMRFWTKQFTGGIPTYVRPRMDVNPKTTELKVLGDASGTFREIVSEYLRLDGISEDDAAAVENFLKASETYTLISSEDGAQVRGWIMVSTDPEPLPDITSDSVCSTFMKSFDALPEEHAFAVAWFVQQIAKIVGQEFVGQKLSGMPERTPVS